MIVTDMIHTSGGTTFVLRCWCGARFSHAVSGRKDRRITCPQCGVSTDLRVLAEMAAMGGENDAARQAAA